MPLFSYFVKNIFVGSRRDVMVLTFYIVANLKHTKFEVIADNPPRYLGRDRNRFRAIRQLQNDYYVEVNLSKQSI